MKKMLTGSDMAIVRKTLERTKKTHESVVILHQSIEVANANQNNFDETDTFYEHGVPHRGAAGRWSGSGCIVVAARMPVACTCSAAAATPRQPRCAAHVEAHGGWAGDIDHSKAQLEILSRPRSKIALGPPPIPAEPRPGVSARATCRWSLACVARAKAAMLRSVWLWSSGVSGTLPPRAPDGGDKGGSARREASVALWGAPFEAGISR